MFGKRCGLIQKKDSLIYVKDYPERQKKASIRPIEAFMIHDHFFVFSNFKVFNISFRSLPGANRTFFVRIID